MWQFHSTSALFISFVNHVFCIYYIPTVTYPDDYPKEFLNSIFFSNHVKLIYMEGMGWVINILQNEKVVGTEIIHLTLVVWMHSLKNNYSLFSRHTTGTVSEKPSIFSILINVDATKLIKKSWTDFGKFICLFSGMSNGLIKYS